MPHKCPEDRKKYHKEYAKRHVEKFRAYMVEYRKTHVNELKRLGAEWYIKKFDSRLRRKYGISQEQYAEFLCAQDNKCGICMSEFGDSYRYVDHDHTTGKVRGLLCMNCNTGLGHFKDNVVLLQSAERYLTK